MIEEGKSTTINQNIVQNIVLENRENQKIVEKWTLWFLKSERAPGE